MPFTPFHLGSGLGLGLPLRRYIHAPTFLLASVIVDIEPFVVLFLGLRYPLHGYLHTFLLAVPTGLILGYVMFLLERFLQSLYRTFLLETGKGLSLKSFLVAGSLGTGLHILLDAPLYTDITPFSPMAANPLYNPALTSEIYRLCVWMGAFGIVYYLALLGLLAYRKFIRKK
ncbi:MAG TPA: hydrolase [bacterium (Candidatus Stahlbacteria)]|nr:hydrolase [Candidatus Stahlbacteria bacterium]